MAERRAVKVWLSVEEFEVVDGLAERAGVETGAVCREAIMRAAGSVARDAAAGRVKLRRRSGAGSEVVGLRRVVMSNETRAAALDDVVPVLDATSPEPGRGKVSRPVVPAAGVGRAELFRRMTARRS